MNKHLTPQKILIKSSDSEYSPGTLKHADGYVKDIFSLGYEQEEAFF